MSTPFTGKNSYSLIKTNPKLTGNIKLVVDSKGQIYLETIDADKELSLNRYKAVKTNERRKFSSDVYQLFNEGKTPASLVYKLAQNENFLSVKNTYAQQYYTQYTQGAYPKVSKEYPEQLAYFAPSWLEGSDIPENFVIFRLNDPVSINTRDIITSYNDVIEKQIYNPDYLNGNTSDYFFNTILKNSEIHKVYDMSENTVIGKYLRNHLQDNNFPESPITIKYNNNEYSTYNGISLKKSGFTEEPEESFDNFYASDKTITEFDNNVTNGFERNSVICANMINFEFLFDDENKDDYEVSRYFGFFVNTEVISKFYLNGKDFYNKKPQNFKQNKDVFTNDQININDKKNFTFKNENGVKLFINGLTNYDLLSADIKNSNYIPYVKGTTNKYFNVNTNTDWSTNEIVLKNKEIELIDFKGYTDESVGVIPAKNVSTSGKGYVELTITGNINNVEVRLKKVNEYNADFSKIGSFIADSSLPQGTFISNKFSSAGLPENSAKALTDVINKYASNDDDFGLSAVNIGNKVIIASRVENDFANTYKWLIYSNKPTAPSITINFNDLSFINVSDYNSTFRTASTHFKGYDDIGATTYAPTSSWILESTLIGGKTSKVSRIRVDAEFFSYFNNTKFLKTNTWFSKIKGVYRYTDDYVLDGRTLIDFTDFFKYVIVDIEDDESIFLSPGNYAYIYNNKPNEVGLLSCYPIKQFDIDQFRSDYKKDGDGYIEKQINYITNNIGVTTPINISSAMNSFSDSGFASLVGIINETTNESPKIDNEYNRLSENELPTLATPGRIIPFINKWVFDDDGKDVRENGYRLNTSTAFGFTSFSPSRFYKTADTRYFTHEWYYLQKFPPYLTDIERIDTFSYFEDFISQADIIDMTSDKFSNYFIQERVSATVDIPRRIKYSIFSGGNDVSYSSVMFRGAKLIIKRRNEYETPLNFNIKNIVTYPSNYFNGYKFAAVLTNDTTSPLSYKIIENKKYKTITFYIEANLDDFYLTLDENNQRYLDRSSLYVIKDKYSADNVISDILLLGAFAPYDAADNKTWDIALDGSFIIKGFQNSTDNSLPDFRTQILPDESGRYNKIEITTIKGIIKIDGIQEVSSDSIKASIFEFSTTGLTYAAFNNSYLNIYPNFANSVKETPIYRDGGFNAFTGIIQNLSFGEIFNKVNNGNPSIEYISFDEDASGNVVKSEDEFTIEFINSDINAKADYLKSEPFITNAVSDNDYKPVGSVITNLNNTYLTPISRVKGNFSPKVNDIVFFNDNHGTKFNKEIRDQLLFKNVQFFSNYPEFALYKQQYINKVNPDNPLTVLELSSESQLKPQWWSISEIAIDKLDSYIFRSDWDHNYYRKYVDKKTFVSLPGYVEPKDVPSMLGSAIMNIPDNISLEKFTSSDITSTGTGLLPDKEILYTLFRTNNDINKVYKIKGKLRTKDKLINQISPSLSSLFNTYVNTRFNFDDLNTLDDDVGRYVLTNILPRYEVVNVEVYGKFTPIGESIIYIEDKYNVQELLQNGFTKLNDVIISGIKENDYDKTFEYSLPSDKDVTLAFVIKIKSN